MSVTNWKKLHFTEKIAQLSKTLVSREVSLSPLAPDRSQICVGPSALFRGVFGRTEVVNLFLSILGLRARKRSLARLRFELRTGMAEARGPGLLRLQFADSDRIYARLQVVAVNARITTIVHAGWLRHWLVAKVLLKTNQ